MDRRSLIIGGAALIAAPAIVRAEWIMPVKVIKPIIPATAWSMCTWDYVEAIQKLDWRIPEQFPWWEPPTIYVDTKPIEWYTPEEALNGWIRDERKNDLSS